MVEGRRAGNLREGRIKCREGREGREEGRESREGRDSREGREGREETIVETGKGRHIELRGWLGRAGYQSLQL